MIIKKAYTLALPYGRKKLLIVMAISLLQGIMQVAGVASIFPFLAIAADPLAFRDTQIGVFLCELFHIDSDGNLFMVSGAFAIFMLVFSNIVNLAAEYVRAHYVYGYGHWLRISLLEKILSKPYSVFLESDTAILQKKVVGDVMQYITGVLLPLLDSFTRIVTLLLLVVLLFVVDPIISLSMGLLFGLYYVSVYRFLSKKRVVIREELKSSNKKFFKDIQNTLLGVKAIKVDCVERHFIDEFSLASKRQAIFMSKLPVLFTAPRYLVEPLAFGSLVVIILVVMASGDNLDDVLPVVGVIALAGYRMLPAAQMIYGQFSQVAALRHTLDEVYDEFLEAESLSYTEDESFHKPSELEWKQSIEFKDVSFSYEKSAKLIINKFNYIIPKNSSVGIVGESGCGKSTLIDMLLGLNYPTKGEISVDKIQLKPDNIRNWRMAIGYVPQDIYITNSSIAENIAFGVTQDEIDYFLVDRVCEVAQLSSLINELLPKGVHTNIGDKGVKLSGGQRQRIGIARALYKQPSVLILDEATSALDVKTESLVMDSIVNFCDGVTLIAIAHRVNTIDQFDYKIDMNELG